MVRSRIEFWHNSDFCQVKPLGDDDVVHFITVPSTSFIYDVERVASSRSDQSDDVVLNLLDLHHQIFDGRFRCKRTFLAEPTCGVQVCHESVLAQQKQGAYPLKPPASLGKRKILAGVTNTF
ncbi:hypothetical protein NECAME_10163 [Necator americanus]|uniref:Uncharacterized protein n=1 Tax=Necator americanus TaxID=51031 RepID=W2TB01_NECAM|nr:hypothetical protein NECAME_10163 [Necator americanus]ETN78749.1 hypothetical protein NECAME_10163 [Necator americanus]